ncbi:MAG: SMC-Scp complex subunit ScpB [Bacteroidia bacterium]|nr:SMC-Scp complex subunit ScpB [Bacteroidia bacterium]MDW8157384.1 SMC-Scp complex subunit ScpB [Bacteroidia bacterium]
MENSPKLSTILEAIFFVSENPLSLKEILQIFERPEMQSIESNKEKIIAAIDELQNKYESPDFAFELKEIAGGYQLLTKAQYATYARQAILHKDWKKLSKAALETLSIIAYKQPITKSEIEFIRGVNCDHALQKLLEKQLIEPAGRADLPGKPLLYRTTHYFIEYFGLKSIEDLPKIKEITANEKEFEQNFQTVASEQ